MSKVIYPTKESFLNDVKNHYMHVLQDTKLSHGVYRHLQFHNGTTNMFFEIVTFPGTLVFTGDMGAFTFERVPDMFTFFRNDELKINSGYWGEKCIAEDIHGGIREWDVEGFRENIRNIVAEKIEEDIDEYIDDLELTDEIIEEYELEELLSAEDEWDCISALRDYSGKLRMDDFFDGFTGMRKTYRFIWCLYAIVWAIQYYDKTKE